MKCPECKKTLITKKNNRFFCLNSKCDVIYIFVKYRTEKEVLKE